MNPGTRLTAADGTAYFVTGDEHAGDNALVKVGDVLTDESGEAFGVSDAGDEIVIIADGAAEGTGQRIFVGEITAPRPRRGGRDAEGAPA